MHVIQQGRHDSFDNILLNWLTIEHTFDSVSGMNSSVHHLGLAIGEFVASVSQGFAVDELLDAVRDVQRQLDLLTVAHSTLVNLADRRRVWDGTGARDMADWLAGTTKTSRGDATSRVKLGAVLSASDELQQAALNGEVSAATATSLFEAVTAKPDDATDDDVALLVAACKGADPLDARKAADAWRDMFEIETTEDLQQRRRDRRSVTTRELGGGMAQLTAIMPIIDLRQVTNAISRVAGKPCEADTRTTEQRMADGLLQLAVAYSKGEVKGGREKPTLLLTASVDSFVGRTDEPGRTAHGDIVPAHVIRFLAEQALVQRVLTAGSQVLDVGREVRYATDAHYKALVVRDGGCRWPGCHTPAAWCDIDHLRPWEDGGGTDLDNLVMWCRHHHSEKHRPGVTVHGRIDDLMVRLIDGTVVRCPAKGASHATHARGRSRLRSQAAA